MTLRGLLALVIATAAQYASANDIVRGAELYRQLCASCHGPQGVSVWPGAPSFARREAMMQPDMALLERIRAGRNAMPGYRGVLTDREILSVIAYTRTLMK